MADQKRLTPAQKKLLEKQNKAATKIQCLVRKFTAKRRVMRRAQNSWQRVFDPQFKLYFWFNKVNGNTQWNIPKFVTLFTDEDDKAAGNICRIVRGFIHRTRARKKVYAKYTRFYDSNVNRFYWMDNTTGQTMWKVSKWLVKQEVPLPPEDKQLFDAMAKIKELEAKLKEKEKDIKQVRRQRYEELEPQVMVDRVEKAKLLTRSKHMDDWQTDELCAWFTELKMEQYIPTLFQNRVDGYLFVNLADEDWHDLGIQSKFHTRKLQLSMKAFRTRYENRKARVGEEDDDLISEYAPSELSDIIRAEEGYKEEVEEEEEEEEEVEAYEEEIEAVELTEEQKLEKEMDEQNIHIVTKVPGDMTNYPMIGDIVRVKYVCYRVAKEGEWNEKLVTSTKNGIGKVSVEFVLGFNQVVKGFDRAVKMMSTGERASITLTPEYAYGAEGLFPHIPPNAEIRFEVTLYGFRPRPAWIKPLIQEPGLSQQPYEPKPGDIAGVFKEDSDDEGGGSASPKKN